MSTLRTPDSPKAWALDVLGVSPQKAIPDSVLVLCTTQAGVVDGDEPSVRVPFVNLDASVGFVEEGHQIDEATPDMGELVLNTGKISVLVRTSREQLNQPSAQEVLSHEIRRAVLAKVDYAMLQTPSPTAPATWPPAGLLAHADAGAAISGDLDVIVDAMSELQIAGGNCSHVVCAPDSWASLQKLKEATGSNKSLLGAGTDSAEKSILSTPVVVTNAMPGGKVLLLDKTRTLSAYTGIQVARSDDYFFGADSVAIRATFRFGVGFAPGGEGTVLTI